MGPEHAWPLQKKEDNSAEGGDGGQAWAQRNIPVEALDWCKAIVSSGERGR